MCPNQSDEVLRHLETPSELSNDIHLLVDPLSNFFRRALSWRLQQSRVDGKVPENHRLLDPSGVIEAHEHPPASPWCLLSCNLSEEPALSRHLDNSIPNQRCPECHSRGIRACSPSPKHRCTESTTMARIAALVMDVSATTVNSSLL